ncbi:hypothetical protein BDF21DRAFT_482609 [Thamnidium elegans]|nr:hypothetical protein BDF21DRAFT_482609 [Thamnidium elegans]
MTDIKNENATHQRGPTPADYMNLMNKIPGYSGSRNVNQAESWLKTVKSYKGFFSVNFNHEMFLTAITNSFTDRAEDWWDTINRNNNSPSSIQLVQVYNNQVQESNHNTNIDINAVKRKGTGSVEENRTTTRRKGKEKETTGSTNMEVYPPESSNITQGNHEYISYVPPTVMLGNDLQRNTPTESIVKPVRKRSVRRVKKEVHVNLQDTWDKLKNTPLTISVAEFLVLNKNAAREVKEGIMYIHRRKPASILRLLLKKPIRSIIRIAAIVIDLLKNLFIFPNCSFINVSLKLSKFHINGKRLFNP